MTTAALIGRDHPAGILRAEIDRASTSHGGLVLVTGEAGIGKTTLVTNAADEARRQGALVLGGSCWDSDSAPGYWPWVQVIRGLRRGATEREWADARDSAGSGLGVLLGESPTAQGADEGFVLYDAVTTALVSVSHSRPVVVVLDDLHWSDTASLKLLAFAAQHAWFERLVLVGTYRDVEVESGEHPLEALILPLVAKATTVTLTGLGQREVAALMARTVGRSPDESLVDEVHRRTGGNPFFVEQTARLWDSRNGTVTGIAPGVREAVRQRLSLLPAPVVRLLTAAAVLGREFHRQVLAATVAEPVAHVDRLLDQAVAARLVEVRDGGRFAFAHDLVRETIYESLDEAEVRRRHAAVVRALDEATGLAERVFPADLARHAYLAGADLDTDRAVDLLLAAARDAGNRIAGEEAIGHYRRALERSERDAQRAVIALDLGREVHHLGDHDEAWRCFAESAQAARRTATPEVLARVAITLHRYDDAEGHDELRDSLLRQAHRALVGGTRDDSPPSRLAHELSDTIAARARSSDDDETLAFGLSARHDTIWGPGTARERELLTAEMEAVARRTDDRDLEQYAASLRWVALLEQGDPRFLAQWHTFVTMAERYATPRFRLGAVVDRSIIATHTGDFAEASALLDELDASSDHDAHPDFAFMGSHLRWALLLLQGRVDDLDALHAGIGETGHPHHRLLAAITAVERGDVEAAARYLREARPDQTPYPQSFLPLWLRFQAQTAAATGDPDLCPRARAALTPFRGEWAVSMYGCDISGPIDLWIATVDAALGGWDDAIAGFTAAWHSADRLTTRPWSLVARTGLAGALLGRGGEQDVRSARELLAAIEREAGDLGMRQVLDRVQALRGDTPSAAPPVAEFRREGAVWSLTYDGANVHLPDAKGLRDLHTLLGSPGVDLSSVDLLDPDGGPAVVAAARLGGDTVLDDEAKLSYRRRLDQLDERIDRAVEQGADTRAAELDREREALLTELRTAAGLGGRDRRLGDEAERARKTVTARIRDTLRKLGERHPALAEHLRATVSTGSTCRYQPDQRITWRL